MAGAGLELPGKDSDRRSRPGKGNESGGSEAGTRRCERAGAARGCRGPSLVQLGEAGICTSNGEQGELVEGLVRWSKGVSE